MKVTILGAAGGIGQPLALLLKTGSKRPSEQEEIAIDELALYDIVGVEGVVKDLEHINVGPKVRPYTGTQQLGSALSGSRLVIIPAGVTQKPGMTRDDLFETDAAIIESLAKAIADHCTENMSVLVITNPVNAMVPLMVEILSSKGVRDAAQKVFGVTTLDVIRATTFVNKCLEKKLTKEVFVVGGHSEKTIVPLLTKMSVDLDPTQLKEITNHVRDAGDEVVTSKGGNGSATLSMAYATVKLVEAVLAGLQGNGAISNIEATYISLDADPKYGPALRKLLNGCEYFSVPVKFGRNGFEGIADGVVDLLQKDGLSELEQELIDEAVLHLKKSIKRALDFVSEHK